MEEPYGNILENFASPLADAPAFGVFLGWCALVSCAETGAFPFFPSCLLSFLVAAGWVLFGTTKPNRSSLSVSVALTLILVAGSAFLYGRVTSHETLPPHIESRGTVQVARSWGFQHIALVRTESGEKYVLRLGREETPVKAGDIVSFSGRTSPFARASEKNKFDEYLYWRAKGAGCAVEPATVVVRGSTGGLPVWREMLNERIEETLPPRTAGYMLASWTGKRNAELESLHRAAGTSHLLAVSGSHVAIVAGISAWLLCGLRHRTVAISLIVWFYTALTGAAPSAVRAAVMIQIVLLGTLVGRSGGAFNATAVAGGVMLLYNPWIFWDVGWRLSMLAVLTLTAIVKVDCSNTAKVILTSPVVWLATALQATWTFGAVPLAGIFANYAALPVFAILLPASFALSIPALAGLPGGYTIAGVAEFFFARWEQFSSNIVYLCPWEILFTAPLALFCTLLLAYLFAIASGFSHIRASLFLFPVALATLYFLVMM